MTATEHASQLARVKRSLLETHCDVYASRDRKRGTRDAAIVADLPAPHPPASAAMSVGSGAGPVLGRV